MYSSFVDTLFRGNDFQAERHLSLIESKPTHGKSDEFGPVPQDSVSVSSQGNRFSENLQTGASREPFRGPLQAPGPARPVPSMPGCLLPDPFVKSQSEGIRFMPDFWNRF
jgi:hypothetical protein